MNLISFKLSNYRNIGPEGISIDDMSRCVLLVGQNNSGKSNTLAGIKAIIDALASTSSVAFGQNDYHRLDSTNRIKWMMKFDISGTELERVLSDPEVWFECQSGGENGYQYTGCSFLEGRTSDELREIFFKLNNIHFGEGVSLETIKAGILANAAQIFNRFIAHTLPQVKTISPIRYIEKGISEAKQKGEDLYSRLHRMQAPTAQTYHLKKRYLAIVDSIRRLIHEPTADINVSHDAQAVLVDLHEQVLPIESYGTGLQQLLILLTDILSEDHPFITIEEPEVHMHPRLQREFLDLVMEHSNAKLIITTHSPSLINAREDVSICSLRAEKGIALGRTVLASREIFECVADLGCRASDIVQSNCVIWVEGPSDRIYILRWLELLFPDLSEGREFSIMFYGGRLLSHLSADPTATDDFIQVLQINQNSVVVMDSDRKTSTDEANATKQRIYKECQGIDSYAWITECREIENFLPTALVNASLEKKGCQPLGVSYTAYDKFEEAIDEYCTKSSQDLVHYERDKVDYARLFMESFQDADFSSTLRSEIDKIGKMITNWNL